MNKRQISIIFRKNVESRKAIRDEASEAVKSFLKTGKKVTQCPTSRKRKVG